jgi:predicted phosphoadenosine phosphosulfate sulfurtransferase
VEILNAQYLHIYTHHGGRVVPYPRAADGAIAKADNKPVYKIISILCAVRDARCHDISGDT